MFVRLTSTAASMLKENPQARPNIYQTLKDACAMQGREVPIKDVWPAFSHLYSLLPLTRPLDLHRQVEIGRTPPGGAPARPLRGCCWSCVLAAATA